MRHDMRGSLLYSKGSSVSANLALIGLGSDTGGSVRDPYIYICYVLSLEP